MSKMYAVGMPEEVKIRPAFTVVELEGTRIKTIHNFDTKKKKIVKKDVEVPAGFMVTFAKGHKLRVDKEGLDRIMKGSPTIQLVDLNKDEVVGLVPNSLVA